MHVKNVTNHIHSLLDELHELYISTPHMSTNVDVHLIIDSFDRQFNSWRNVARLFARTNYVMMLDVDFAICTDFRKAIRSSNVIMDKLREGHSALVIPAFEFINHSEGLDYDRFPRNKEVSLYC
jgi:glycosyltransferase-like protein LARGE